jgi:hypothetical protein
VAVLAGGIASTLTGLVLASYAWIIIQGYIASAEADNARISTRLAASGGRFGGTTSDLGEAARSGFEEALPYVVGAVLLLTLGISLLYAFWVMHRAAPGSAGGAAGGTTA